MSDLSGTDPTQPLFNASVGQGDDQIRALKADVLGSFGLQHSLTGQHKFNYGSFASRPAVGHAGDIYFDTTNFIVWRDDGTNWRQLNAVQIATILGSASSIFAGVFNAVANTSVTVPLGGRVVLAGLFNIVPTGAGGTIQWTTRIIRDSATPVVTNNRACDTLVGTATTVPIFAVETPGAGTFNYAMEIFSNTTILTGTVGGFCLVLVL